MESPKNTISYTFNCPCCGTPLENRDNFWICKKGNNTFKEIDFNGNIDSGPLLTVQLIGTHNCCGTGKLFHISGKPVSPDNQRSNNEKAG